MIPSLSLSHLADIRAKNEGRGTYIGDLGSKTFDAFVASGRKEMTRSERDAVSEETKLVRMMLQGFIKPDATDPMATARAAVAETPQRDFDSRDAALADAVRSIGTMARAASAEQSSRGNIASAEAVREGASDSLRASINHVVAKETTYLTRLFGQMSVTAAMLERDFTVTGTILGRDDSGATTLGGFALSHARFGTLLSVDDRGVVTLFDARGGVMDQAATDRVLPGGSGPFAPPRGGGAVVDRWM